MSTLQEQTTKRHHFPLTLLTTSIIMVILFFGLWPHSWPTINDAQLLPAEKTLRFHGSGIAYTERNPVPGAKSSSSNFTIHLRIAPETVQKKGFKPILMFNDGDDQKQLTVWHWGSSLIVMNGNDYNYARKWPRISAIDALSAKENIFLTITTDNDRTRLFINGAITNEAKELTLSIPSNRKQLRLILGNSVYGKHGWAGDMSYFAWHDKAFSIEDVQYYYDNWAAGSHSPPAPISDTHLLYTFNSIEQKLIYDQSGHNMPLHLPAKVPVFKRAFLTIPLYDFKANRSFWTDTILNLIGFIPLGAVVYSWLQHRSALQGRKKIFISLTFCFSLSLAIELLQGWIPHRSSSLLDLILNTLGATLGIVLLSIILRMRNPKSAL